MKKLSLAWKAGMLCLGALIGSVFGPKAYKETESPAVVQARIEKNLHVIEKYLDLKYGAGFFKKQIMQHASRTEMQNMLESQAGTEIYKDSLKTL